MVQAATPETASQRGESSSASQSLNERARIIGAKQLSIIVGKSPHQFRMEIIHHRIGRGEIIAAISFPR